MTQHHNIFGWSQWSDILIFTFGNTSYVLQGKKHKRGKTRFRIVRAGTIMGTDCNTLSIEDLKKAGLWKQIEA